MFTVDGLQWPYPCDISRNAEIRATEVSGEMLDGVYYNDVKGTYYTYTVTMAVPIGQRDVVTNYYEKLTDPVSGHTFIFPYNQSTVTMIGRLEGVGDVFMRLPNGQKYWKGLRFTVLPNAPTQELSLGEVLSRGRQALPDVFQAAEGDTWVWTNGAWALSSHYDSADAVQY